MTEQVTTETTRSTVHPIAVEIKVSITAVATREADGRFSIFVPALPGCFSEADTLDEVVSQAHEAATGWLASMHDREMRREAESQE